MINWAEIDTVLLDMDGTLLDLHFDNYFWLEHLPQRYADTWNIERIQAEKTLKQKIEQQRGTLNWYCLDYWSDTLGVDIVKLKREISHKIAYRPEVKSFLNALQQSPKNVVLVTNAHRKSLDLKLEFTDLASWYNLAVSSHDFGIPKEETTFWGMLKTKVPFNFEKTVFIDDSLPVLRSAQAYGIKHLYTIAQPDSKKPKREVSEFPAIDCFSQLKNLL